MALYHGTIPNVRYVGKGSGKLNRYLRAGKPVIVDRNANLEFVADYEAGVVVDDPSGIPAAIETIRASYDQYAANARTLLRRGAVVRGPLADGARRARRLSWSAPDSRAFLE